jgi:magnesium-transporting ATPase (P-type)
MSVLVRNCHSNKSYIFVKGSPEMIHANSSLKYGDYDAFIKKLSLEGFRSISFGYR